MLTSCAIALFGRPSTCSLAFISCLAWAKQEMNAKEQVEGRPKRAMAHEVSIPGSQPCMESLHRRWIGCGSGIHGRQETGDGVGNRVNGACAGEIFMHAGAAIDRQSALQRLLEHPHRIG